MKTAILGYGAWGGIHAASLRDIPAETIVAIACRTPESAEKARSENPGATVTLDWREAASLDDVEVVHVCLPSHLHADAAVFALESGKHVLAEKPMANTVDDAQRVVHATRDCPGTLTVVHELRISAQWGAVKGLIDGGKLGRPRYALLNLFRFPYRSGAGGWRYRKEEVGSWILEEPIHFFDLLCWYFEELGDPVSVSAREGGEDDENLPKDFSAVVGFPGGAYGIITQTLSGWQHHQTVEIAGEKGAVRSLWSGALDRTDKPDFSVSWAPQGGQPDFLDLGAPSGELFEIKEYIRRAHQGFGEGRSLYTAERGAMMTRLCIAAEESARTGMEVTLT